MNDNKLREVSHEQIRDVLLALKEDWPSSIHMYYFIWMHSKWFVNNPNLKSLKVYRTETGDEELFLATTVYQVGESLVYRVMLHSLMKDVKNLKQLILTTDAIDWDSNPMFEAVIEKDIPVITEICEMKNKLCSGDGLFYQVWLPTEKQKKISINIPSDMYIGELTEEHVTKVDDTWRYKYPGSNVIVRDTIVVNKGLGLFRKSDNKLIAWNTIQHFAGLGMLYTEDDERGKGFGSLITLALAKYLVDKEVDPFACISVRNDPSFAVYKKLGFEVTDKVTWISTSEILPKT